MPEGQVQDQGRSAKIAKIKEAIAGGVYETRDKLEATVDRLLSVLRGVVIAG